MPEKYVVIEYDRYDKTKATIATRISWEKACEEVDQLKAQRTPRLNCRYGFEIKPVEEVQR